MRYRTLIVTAAVAAAGACASAPPKPAVPVVTADQKMAWILQLEDQRILHTTPPPPVIPATPPGRKGRAKAAPAPPPNPIDLARLVTDPEPRIRRRAAIAVGRVGLPAGVPLVQPLLNDTDPDVRQMAAFALGLIGDKTAVASLTTALQDADPRVRGRAAEALGLIGDPAAGAPVGQMVAAYIHQGAIAQIQPDDEKWPMTAEADAVRLGLFALVRLKAWDPLAAAVLDTAGHPVSQWWPVAYALQRIGDPRAAGPLADLAHSPGRYTRGFAADGLGAIKTPAAVALVVQMLGQAKGDAPLQASIVRALAQTGSADAVHPILSLLDETKDRNVELAALTALGTLKAHDALPSIQDRVTDDWPTMRAAALEASARIDPDGFVLLLSGMDPDREWIVRAGLAEALGSLPPAIAVPRLEALANDQDLRVVPSALASLVKLKAPGIDALLLDKLKAADFGVRAAAARQIGRLKPAGGADALRAAYTAGLGDATYVARGAALTALAAYGAAEATETLHTALADKDWAVRVHAAELLHRFDPAADVADAIRPAPVTPIVPYTASDVLNPPYSPHAFIETAKGTIEIELNVVDSPQTAQNFIALAHKGFFNGLQVHRVVPYFVVQDGDPRGDGEGGPGYTIRDELSGLPYLRGTVGMALSWPDTGGSQFFITTSPRPHLDAQYTVFGRVVNGMDVVDRIQQLDTIQRVRIWDGKEMR